MKIDRERLFVMGRKIKDLNLPVIFLQSVAATGFALISSTLTAGAVMEWKNNDNKSRKEKVELVAQGAAGVAGLIFSFLVAAEPIPPRRRKINKKSDNSPEEDSPEPPQT